MGRKTKWVGVGGGGKGVMWVTNGIYDQHERIYSFAHLTF